MQWPSKNRKGRHKGHINALFGTLVTAYYAVHKKQLIFYAEIFFSNGIETE